MVNIPLLYFIFYHIFILIENRQDPEIVTITAKIWYVSDFTGDQGRWKIPQSVIDSLDEDTPLKRLEVIVKANLDYMNVALANSEIPIRYTTWGSFQDIGKNDAEIGQRHYNDIFAE